MMNGLMYVDVQNAIYPGGEVRTQLIMVPDGKAEYYDARLQGAQQVPPNGSTAMGSAHILVDISTDSVFLTGSFSGLAAPCADGTYSRQRASRHQWSYCGTTYR